MAKKTPIDKLDTAIKKILDDYGDDVSRDASEVTKKMAQKGATAVNQQAAAKFGGNKYRKSWTSQYEETRLTSTAVIYSKMPGLPHLLENGHAKRNGGRWNGVEHIKPVEEKLATEYETMMKVKL